MPTVSFRVLYVFVVLAHDRRRHIHFNVTARPTAEWAAQQIVHAFPWDTVPRYLIRDRDGTYGQDFRQRMKEMGIHEVLTAPRSPWQNAYAERLIGSIRRECLDHVIVLNESSLQRILNSYFDYYPTLAHPLVARQGRPGTETSSATGSWRGDRTAPGWRASPPLRTTSRIEFPCARSPSVSLDLDKSASAPHSRGSLCSSDALVGLRPAQFLETLRFSQQAFSHRRSF